MKKILLLPILAIAFIFMAFSPLEDEEKFPILKIGKEMPMKDAAMKSTSGNEMTLSDIKKDKGTLVIFSCNTCPFVIKWEESYKEAMAISDRYGIGVAVVNSNEAKRDGDDSFQAMQMYAREQGYTAPYLVDENSILANTFGAKTTPHIFLFDANDKLVYEGAFDNSYESTKEVKETYLVDALAAVYKGKKVNPAKTPAKGCSIKRVK